MNLDLISFIQISMLRNVTGDLHLFITNFHALSQAVDPWLKALTSIR